MPMFPLMSSEFVTFVCGSCLPLGLIQFPMQQKRLYCPVGPFRSLVQFSNAQSQGILLYPEGTEAPAFSLSHNEMQNQNQKALS